MKPSPWTRINIQRAMEAWRDGVEEIEDVIERVIELIVREGVSTQPPPGDQLGRPASSGSGVG